MSRTGVGCRVLIDGRELDDGCIDWGAIPPVYSDYIETRRNLATDPRGTATAGWIGSGSVPSSVSGAAFGEATAERFEISAAGAQRGGLLIPLAVSTLYTARFRARGSVERSTWALYYRPTGPASSTGQVQLASGLALGATVRDFEYAFTTTATASTASGSVCLVNGNGQAAEWFEICLAAVELGDTRGQGFFDGSTLEAGPKKYQWTGAADASASVELTAQTSAPTIPPDLIGPGVSASEGLQIVWGRGTSVDQPEAATCAFTVIDDPGGPTVLSALQIGARVDIYADAAPSGGAGAISAFDDPSFDAELRVTSTSVFSARSQLHADDPGGWSARIRAKSTSNPSTWARFPPSQLQPAGTNPAAWDHLPRVSAGETWTIRVRLFVPSNVTAWLRPVIYTGPYSTSATPAQAPVFVANPAAGWQTAEITWAPGVADVWLGFQIDLWGVGTPWDAVQPPELIWDAVQPPELTWDDIDAVFIDTVQILPPAPGPQQTVGVFSGRITDLEGFWDDGWQLPAMNVTASDFLADLGNRRIGAEPWPAESVATRVPKILELAAIPGEPPLSIDIAPTLAPILLSTQDVDSRPAAGMLTDIAQSVDGVLWAASHPAAGAYIRIEDPAQRLALYQLALDAGQIIIEPVAFTDPTTAPPAISACDVLRDPVTFALTVSDIATRVDATYLEQPTPPATDTIERHVKIINAQQEQIYGTRGVSISTDLTTVADATRVADQLIARLIATWRISGLVFSDADIAEPDAEAAQSMLILLNNVTRGGQPLQITDLDAWSPIGQSAPVYLEGGEYTYAGGWSLSLIVSRSFGIGASAAWNDLPDDPAWSWDAFDPAITWNDLRGVAGPS